MVLLLFYKFESNMNYDDKYIYVYISTYNGGKDKKKKTPFLREKLGLLLLLFLIVYSFLFLNSNI